MVGKQQQHIYIYIKEKKGKESIVVVVVDGSVSNYTILQHMSKLSEFIKNFFFQL